MPCLWGSESYGVIAIIKDIGRREMIQGKKGNAPVTQSLRMDSGPLKKMVRSGIRMRLIINGQRCYGARWSRGYPPSMDRVKNARAAIKRCFTQMANCQMDLKGFTEFSVRSKDLAFDGG